MTFTCQECHILAQSATVFFYTTHPKMAKTLKAFLFKKIVSFAKPVVDLQCRGESTSKKYETTKTF